MRPEHGWKITSGFSWISVRNLSALFSCSVASLAGSIAQISPQRFFVVSLDRLALDWIVLDLSRLQCPLAGMRQCSEQVGQTFAPGIIIVSPGRDSRRVTEQRNFLCKDWSTKDNIKAKVGQGPISEVRKVRITHKGPKLNKSYHFILVSLCFCILIGPRSNPATSLNRI